MGGVRINEKAEVISATTQKPIKGLYAGGEVTGGVHGASRLGTVASSTPCLRHDRRRKLRRYEVILLRPSPRTG